MQLMQHLVVATFHSPEALSSHYWLHKDPVKQKHCPNNSRISCICVLSAYILSVILPILPKVIRLAQELAFLPSCLHKDITKATLQSHKKECTIKNQEIPEERRENNRKWLGSI